MKTSSSVGRETLTDRIATPRSANRRGTNSSPDGTKNATAPSDGVASSLEAVGERRDGGFVVLGLDPHAIGADRGLQRRRRVERDDLAAGP